MVQSRANNNNREPDIGLNRNDLNNIPTPPIAVNPSIVLNRDGTGEFLKTLDTCQNICGVIT